MIDIGSLNPVAPEPGPDSRSKLSSPAEAARQGDRDTAARTVPSPDSGSADRIERSEELRQRLAALRRELAGARPLPEERILKLREELARSGPDRREALLEAASALLRGADG